MDQSLDDLIKSKKGNKQQHQNKRGIKPHGDVAAKASPAATSAFSLGTSEQLGMSLDDLIMKKRESVKNRRPGKAGAAVEGGKQRAAVQVARTKRQATLNQKRGLPATTQTKSATNASVVTRVPAARRRATQLSTNMLRRVNLGKRQTNTKATGAKPRLQAWEKHSLDHPKKFTLPEGGNFKVTIDLNRVEKVVGLSGGSTKSLRQ
ncbi:Aste57867_25337 [Aphanomyces stellatus]|uniref:Aste57867_25337 protein n=1 Tax=Aphanomyces stellatus TaxID=120398 RepID=A0A485LST6_9STRA|nr:hypothetical protein As57867_025259 [Aphanomyces stellatus]VFU01962.1 Aste57867_25337 [Aphanomyces stellatus]